MRGVPGPGGLDHLLEVHIRRLPAELPVDPVGNRVQHRRVAGAARRRLGRYPSPHYPLDRCDDLAHRMGTACADIVDPGRRPRLQGLECPQMTAARSDTCT